MSLSLGPRIIIISMLMAAAPMYRSSVWRRRIYFWGYSILAAFLLYRVDPGDYVAVCSAVCGNLIGLAFFRKGKIKRFESVSSHEARRFTSIVSAVFSLGPLIAVDADLPMGPMSRMGLLISSVTVSPDNLQSCNKYKTVSQCLKTYGLYQQGALGAVALFFLFILAMIIVSNGLYRGLRSAAIISIIFNTVYIGMSFYTFILHARSASNSSGLSAGKIFGVPSDSFASFMSTSIPPLALIIAVAVLWKSFSKRTESNLIYRGALIIAGSALLFSLAYAMLLTHTRNLRGHVMSLKETINLLPGHFFPARYVNSLRIGLMPEETWAQFIYQAIGPAMWVVICIVFAKWFSPKSDLGIAERDKAVSLICENGESMSWMTTWEGNSYWFSETKDSGIAYRINGSTALALTGPFGDTSEYENDIKSFSHYCADNDLNPVFFNVHEETKEYLESQGWASIDLGVEMVVDTRNFATKGKKWQDIRTAINRAKREGIKDVLETFEQTSPFVRAQIAEISEEWTSGKSLPEMGFTLGGLDEIKDPHVILLYAVDENNIVMAVTSWMPAYRDGVIVGWTLDFMRHAPNVMNGIMEFLIARMAERMRDDFPEVEFISLSAAPLSGMDVNNSQSVAIVHVLQLVSDIMEPVYGFKSLFNFKKKFQPSEQHVYMCFPDEARLMHIAKAVGEAYMPDMNVLNTIALLRAAL